MGAPIKHKKTGIIYESRKDAKSRMGHYEYERALKEREFIFLTNTDNQ